VIPLLRYESAILLRSHRWIVPLMVYGLLLTVAGAGSGGTSLRNGLDWSAAILVPVVAMLTRSMLTAEPGAARACVAAATGPIRAQLATLLTAIGGGVVLALVGALYEVLTDQAVIARVPPPSIPAKLGLALAHPGTLLAGLVTAIVCLLVGSAVGALCNPPLIRHQATALLGTIAAVVLALASDVSPAGAALRGGGSGLHSSGWPAGVPVWAAMFLLLVSWSASALVSARRPD
jgi:hypothetical protein